MTEKQLGAAIRKAREEKGYSQEKLAELVEMSRQAVSKWEKGLAVPTQDNLKRLEGALELPAGTLSELAHTDDTPAQKSNVKSPTHLALFALLLIAASAGSFALGRSTAPAPAAEEPETKLIWKLTEVHHVVNPDPYDADGRMIYDDMGRLLREELVNWEDGSAILVEEHIRDEAGNCIQCTSYDQNGEFLYRYEREYDDMGNETLVRYLNADGTVRGWTEITYDDHGNPISHQGFNAQGELEHSNRYSYTYYEDGTYERDSSHPAGENSEFWHVAHRFDTDGNLLEYTRYDLEGNVVEYSYYVYQSFEVPIDFEPKD